MRARPRERHLRRAAFRLPLTRMFTRTPFLPECRAYSRERSVSFSFLFLFHFTDHTATAEFVGNDTLYHTTSQSQHHCARPPTTPQDDHEVDNTASTVVPFSFLPSFRRDGGCFTLLPLFFSGSGG